ncbi:hypothetical protein [Crateriforma conspicua]|uniref:hypothetical protein n=1 Tax=Crateriforma conspicua TaxID=2527996 RepID=UPI001E3B6126|nr:hypothetical protein [Crateriforma conspicua]
MLDGRQFIVVEPFGPRHVRAGIHRFTVPPIEISASSATIASTQSFSADFGVAKPQLLIGRKRIHHSSAFAVPFRVEVTAKDVVGHVPGADDRARHDARDLLTRAGQSEHRAGEDGFAVGTLRKRTSGFVGLRIVEDDK